MNKLQQAIALHQEGRLEEAKAVYLELLPELPENPDIVNLLGLIAFAKKEYVVAEHFSQKAIQLNARSSMFYNNLGNALAYQKKYSEAKKAYQTSVSLQPDYLEAHYNLGNVLYWQNELIQAEKCYLAALKIKSNHYQTLCHLGILYRKKREFTKSIYYFRQSLAIEPDNYMVWLHLSYVLGEYPGPKDLIKQCLEQEKVEWSSVVDQAVIQIVKEFSSNQSWWRDPLFVLMLTRGIVKSQTIELYLTQLRKDILLLQFPIDSIEKECFIYALAIQCLLTEFNYGISQEEERAIKIIEQKIIDNNSTWIEKAIYGCYKPLYQINFDQTIPKNTSQYLTMFIQHHLLGPKKEISLREKIIPLTAISAGTSQEVQQQYEECPYPRWLTFASTTKISYEQYLEEQFLVQAKEKFSYQEPLNILVVGCGTGNHPISIAKTIENCLVTAIDLSKASLSYALRKAQELEVNNIKFLQADLLNVTIQHFAKPFDVIECAGVLHHLHNPTQGLAKLIPLVRAGGLIHLSLYSRLGRRHLPKIRQLIQQHQFSASQSDIRAFRQMIFQLPKHDFNRFILYNEEFYTLSMCRDLLFHVMEHNLDLTEIATMIQQYPLEFLGFSWEDDKIIQQYQNLYPNDPDCLSLMNWHEFEQKYPDTFCNMYHFCLYRS